MGLQGTQAITVDFTNASSAAPCGQDAALSWDTLQASPALVFSLFDAAFAQTGCTVSLDSAPAGSAPASYLPFIYCPEGGGKTFRNEILIRSTRRTDEGIVARTPEQIEISARHEKMHSIQWARNPALHASPYNQASPLVLSPESWVLMTILTERDAFVKTAWLNALDLAARPSDTMARQAETETVTPSDIDSARGDIRAALERASTVWDQRLKHKTAADEPDTTLLDHYIRQAIEAYEDSNRLNSRRLAAPVFVRLSQEDILKIGASFGPSTFGEGAINHAFSRLPLMRPELWSRLQALNQKHGITNELSLPTFSEALAHIQQTPRQYLEASRTHIYHAPVLNSTAEQSYEIPAHGQVPDYTI